MPTLGKYLGALLGEIANARMQADLESVRIAQLYATHPLLEHMAVPRFRLPSVQLDLPVAIEDLTSAPAPSPQLGADLNLVRQKTDAIIAGELSQRKIQLAPNIAAELKMKLDNLFNTLARELQKPSDSSWLVVAQSANQAVEAVLNAIKMSAGESAGSVYPDLEPALRRQLASQFSKLQPPGPNVEIVVVTSKLKELSPSENLTRIQLSITEEGVEWTQTNPSDPKSKTLLPE